MLRGSLALLLLLVLYIVLPAAQGKQLPQAKSLAVTHVTVVNVEAKDAERALVPDQTVIVTGDRITAIGRTGRVRVPAGAQVIDATGKFLIPGLWDMHVHLFNNVSAPGTNNKDAYFPLFIANGVTGVRDMFTDPDDIKLVRDWQKEVKAGTMLAPRIFVGSSIVDGVPVFQKNSLGVSTPDEARRAVRMLKNAGAGFIKVYDNLSRESYYAIADEARMLKIPFAGHVPDSVTAAEASNAGQKSIEHLTRMFVACSSAEDRFKDIKEAEWTAALFLEMMQSYSEQKCREVAAVFVRNGTWHDPTLVERRSTYLGDDEAFKKDVRLRYVPADEVRGWIKLTERLKPASRKNRELRVRRLLEIVNVMHGAGVPLLAGTDVSNPFVYAGFSLHDELAAFVEAGLSPFEALKTATVNPAKFLGREKELGVVRRGNLADLVLLDADPLTDIANTRRISAVVVNGRLLDRKALDSMLAQVEASANRK
jgi:imidazolonepropionase-like amidohydrolase